MWRGPTARLRKRVRSAGRTWREARMFAAAMKSASHPVVAQIVPIRRCNLACAYCNEYDKSSEPVPAVEMLRRIDKLAELGTTVVTFSGGEPTLHPDLDALISRVRERGAIATIITNGLLLTPERIRRLNRAGLDYLQISIDNARPDEVSHKSLQVLDRKLEWLAEHADFAVTINSVLGGGIRNPEDAHTIAKRARELGFTSTIGILHDGSGQLTPLKPAEQSIYARVLALGGGMFSFAQYDAFQRNIARGIANQWHCPAGGRYLYICEDGLVHYCSQQRGRPGIPLAQYTTADVVREAAAVKGCAPFCTISCVHQTAMLDGFRKDPRRALTEMLDRRREQDPGFRPPAVVAVLAWMFLNERRRGWFGRVAARLLGADQRAAS